jgi:hypothetical protein
MESNESVQPQNFLMTFSKNSDNKTNLMSCLGDKIRRSIDSI